tara:strand:+ start:83 stop:598 length:516 start_codon:yes stop_codon:yes gene_type:complete
VNKLKRNLVLTGMMGSGKSTIGKSLSERLNTKFIDIDNIIEKKLSLSISQIFESKGEDFFRDKEREETIKALKNENIVIALGGGAFMDETIRENIKKSSFSVWLDIDIDEIFKRIKSNKKRPLLKNISKESLEKLCEERKKTYLLADCKINCNLKTKNEIVEKIKKLYENT